MDLKTLLGASYKEGITEAEINEALKDRNIADLATGDYVGKGKYDAAIKKNEELKSELDGFKESHKDYDDIKKELEGLKAEKKDAETKATLVGYGADEKSVDYVKFLVESGKIDAGKDGKNLEASVKKFLTDNPQYAAQKPGPQKLKPFVTNPNNTGDDDKGPQLPKKTVSKPWNRH